MTIVSTLLKSDITITNKFKSNKFSEQEAKHLEEIESSRLDNANTIWDRIAKIVESGGSKASKNNMVKDTSRMKSLILSKRDTVTVKSE